MTMEKILEGLIAMEIAQSAGSKVTGKRNWMIATANVNEKLIIRYAGTKGAGAWCESCFLTDIAKYNYRWFYFTYKKDYEKALKALKEAMENEKRA